MYVVYISGVGQGRVKSGLVIGSIHILIQGFFQIDFVPAWTESCARAWYLTPNLSSALPCRGGGEAGCVDYVQFGEDDSIPFVTINKSKKLCGNVEKWNYNVGVNKETSS